MVVLGGWVFLMSEVPLYQHGEGCVQDRSNVSGGMSTQAEIEGGARTRVPPDQDRVCKGVYFRSFRVMQFAKQHILY